MTDHNGDGRDNNEHVIVRRYPLPEYCTKLYLMARHLALILSIGMRVAQL
jgi:hypothetical protein